MENVIKCKCGCEEYYIKQSYKGTFEYVIRYDGKETDNSHMFDNATSKDISKYAYCCDCKKKLFKLSQQN